jgi:hypothetical protein
LFLYQLTFDGSMRNLPLDQGQKTPLWLVLYYLLTAFDESRESDSADAHELLGEGMLALQELNYLDPAQLALADNPEPLKITFDNGDSELLSKIMQGTDEKYRISAAFQIRPVMIAPSEPPLYSLPVQTIGPPSEEGVVVLPTVGPHLHRVEPEKFIAGDSFDLFGTDIGSTITEVRLGNIVFPITMGREGNIQSNINPATLISAGSYPITVFRPLPGGKGLTSNAVFARLLPTVTSVTANALVDHITSVSGTLQIIGNNLGDADADKYVAFYQDGEVKHFFEAAVVTDQSELQVTVVQDDDVILGTYFVIIRINGEQTPNVFEVDWIP